MNIFSPATRSRKLQPATNGAKGSLHAKIEWKERIKIYSGECRDILLKIISHMSNAYEQHTRYSSVESVRSGLGSIQSNKKTNIYQVL